MLTPSEIKTFIDHDAVSDKKRFARTGVRYDTFLQRKAGRNQTCVENIP